MLPQTGEETRRFQCRAGLDRTFVPATQRMMRARGSRTLASALCSHKRGRKPAASNVAPGLTVPSFPHPNAGCEPEARAPWQAHDAPYKRGKKPAAPEVAPGLTVPSFPHPGAGCGPEARAPWQAHYAPYKRGKKPAAPEVAPGLTVPSFPHPNA